MLKQERARVTRANIVSSAALSFHQHGFGKTSLSDIIEEAGVTKGALYFHFESKEDVARAVLDAQLERVASTYHDLETTGRPALEVMLRLCAAPVAAVEQEALADFRLAVEISSLQPALTQPYYRSWLDYVGTLAHRARDEGALRSDVDPEALARVVIAAITGMDLISDVFSGGTDLLGRQREFWSILLPQVMEDNQASAINGILDRVLADG